MLKGLGRAGPAPLAEVAVEVATDDAHLENTELVLGEKILALVVRMLWMMMTMLVFKLTWLLSSASQSRGQQNE